jgi:hypothetical protein
MVALYTPAGIFNLAMVYVLNPLREAHAPPSGVNLL